MKSKIPPCVRWLIAMTVVLSAGVVSIGLTEFISPKQMTGWQRLHITLPVLSSLGYFFAFERPLPVSFRQAFYFCLATTMVAFTMAITLLWIPGQSRISYLTIFSSIAVAPPLIELMQLLVRAYRRSD